MQHLRDLLAGMESNISGYNHLKIKIKNKNVFITSVGMRSLYLDTEQVMLTEPAAIFLK